MSMRSCDRWRGFRLKAGLRTRSGRRRAGGRRAGGACWRSRLRGQAAGGAGVRLLALAGTGAGGGGRGSACWRSRVRGVDERDPLAHARSYGAGGRKASACWRSRVRGRGTKGIHSLTLVATGWTEGRGPLAGARGYGGWRRPCGDRDYGTFFSSGFAGAATGAGSKSSSDFCGRLVKV